MRTGAATNRISAAWRRLIGGAYHAIIDVGLNDSLRVLMRKPGIVQGRPVTVAVRPEKIELQWQRPADTVNAIPGKVSSDAYFGDRSHYFVEVAKLKSRFAVAMQNSRPSAAASDSRGRDVWLTWNAEAAVLLSRDESSAA